MSERATDNFWDIVRWMKKNHYDCQTNNYTMQQVQLRESGHEFYFDEHLEGLIWSLLSQQRPWYIIEQHKDEIREIFNGFDFAYIQSVEPKVLEGKIRAINCGHRRLHAQMCELQENINTLWYINDEYGSLDKYVTSKDPDEIARDLSTSYYFKLKGVGPALALEYLKNVGVDCVKPDVHILRILERFGYVVKNEYSAYNIVKRISKETDIYMSTIGTVFWQFCATGYLEICAATPKCAECPVDKCRYGRQCRKEMST